MRLKLLIQKSNIAPNGLRFYSNCILSGTYILLLMIRFGVDYIDSDSKIDHVCKTFITLHVYDRIVSTKNSSLQNYVVRDNFKIIISTNTLNQFFYL